MNHLPALLQEFHADLLLDAACGDFNWMRHTNLGKVRYVGVDIVPDLIRKNQQLYDEPGRIEFLVADITKDPLPRADAILCRDCSIHLSYSRIKSAISNFKTTGAKYLLCTTHTSITDNVDCPDGGWRSLNLQLEPFNFPEPLKLIVEDAEAGKCVGVWQLSEL
ncbi:MAG TPA: class I SAM-dependent methyltransferase [Pyrinomonadaceae bacterium]|nr:class I SAM-dependent methyltransferase [Pyrinomonadaceae bacterium]